MKAPTRRVVLISLALALVSAALLVKWQFDRELQRARIQAAHGSALLSTPCGPIEYQEAGAGVPLLAVHGSGGGHGQGMALAGASPDLSFWSALHISRDQLIKYVLATPSELLAHARARELARVHAILDNVLPVSPRAQGLRSDTALGKHLTPLQLHTMRLPTLVFSARDDRYDTQCGVHRQPDSRGRVHRIRPGRASSGGTQRRGHGGHRRAAGFIGPAMNNPMGSWQ